IGWIHGTNGELAVRHRAQLEVYTHRSPLRSSVFVNANSSASIIASPSVFHHRLASARYGRSCSRRPLFTANCKTSLGRQIPIHSRRWCSTKKTFASLVSHNRFSLADL